LPPEIGFLFGHERLQALQAVRFPRRGPQQVVAVFFVEFRVDPGKERRVSMGM